MYSLDDRLKVYLFEKSQIEKRIANFTSEQREIFELGRLSQTVDNCIETIQQLKEKF